MKNDQNFVVLCGFKVAEGVDVRQAEAAARGGDEALLAEQRRQFSEGVRSVELVLSMHGWTVRAA